MKVYENEVWKYFLSDEEPDYDQDRVGKWMFFYKGGSERKYLEERCIEAISLGIVEEAKIAQNKIEGVACFYLESDDTVVHLAAIEFFLINDMIQKTRTGKLYNISFKLDSQTRAGQYGKAFESGIKLEQFVDLETGEWV